MFESFACRWQPYAHISCLSFTLLYSTALPIGSLGHTRAHTRTDTHTHLCSAILPNNIDVCVHAMELEGVVLIESNGRISHCSIMPTNSTAGCIAPSLSFFSHRRRPSRQPVFLLLYMLFSLSPLALADDVIVQLQNSVEAAAPRFRLLTQVPKPQYTYSHPELTASYSPPRHGYASSVCAQAANFLLIQ